MAGCQESKAIMLEIPPVAEKRRVPLAPDVTLDGHAQMVIEPPNFA
jgi:hypothetical protein